MSGPDGFEFVDDVTSDLSFVARGETLEQVFRAAAEALLAATVEEPSSVEPRTRRPLELEDDAPDLLLRRFLNELVFLRDAEGLLLRPGRLALEIDARAHLRAELEGEAFEPARHTPVSEVKAVTAYGLRCARTPEGWEATVTFDV